jgi:SSS family transporter
MRATLLAELGSRFTWPDWLVIAGYLLATTVIGAKLAGKQATIRDFFLAGRKLPWWAISSSIIATEISAVTFVAVPTISFAVGGNLTYMQWAIGAIIARVIIGLYFVPKYYEREIYSPYDYLETRLGVGIKKLTTALFLLGAVLGQGARLYITAFVLSAVTGLGLVPSIWIIGAFSVCWTLLGGMTTVIWTDVIQFLVFTIGACLALYWSVTAVPGGVSEILPIARAAGKFEWFDGTTDLSMPYTIWIGLLAMPFLNLAAFGTDQVMAQRIFCCRTRRDAAKAIIVSNVGIVLALVMLLVGVALWAYFRHNPLTPREAQLFSKDENYLLPIFVVRAMPVGVRAVIVAAIFAAAISTLDGALTALAQTTVDLSAKRRAETARRRGSGRWAALLSSDIAFSKALVVAWAAVLCLMGMACIVIARQYANAVELAFALVGYTYGPMLGIFLLAFLPTGRDHTGLVWAVPMSVLMVFGMYQHGVWANWIVWAGVAFFLLLALIRSQGNPRRVAVIVIGALAIALLHRLQLGTAPNGAPIYLAFNWSYPIGVIMTFTLGYCLGKRVTFKGGL